MHGSQTAKRLQHDYTAQGGVIAGSWVGCADKCHLMPLRCQGQSGWRLVHGSPPLVVS